MRASGTRGATRDICVHTRTYSLTGPGCYYGGIVSRLRSLRLCGPVPAFSSHRSAQSGNHATCLAATKETGPAAPDATRRFSRRAQAASGRTLVSCHCFVAGQALTMPVGRWANCAPTCGALCGDAFFPTAQMGSPWSSGPERLPPPLVPQRYMCVPAGHDSQEYNAVPVRRFDLSSQSSCRCRIR